MEEAKKEQEDPTLWSDAARTASNGKKIKSLERELGKIKRVDADLSDIDFLCDLFELEPTDEIGMDITKKADLLEEFVESAIIDALLNGKYDNNDAILSIHAGAGGTEAQDWADMLYRMYVKYSEKQGYKVTVLDYQAGDTAGIKSVVFSVQGEKAYGYLKAEKGVHRLVRHSPFDANNKRHTSFASLDVMPEIDEAVDIEINPEELQIETCRAGGAGGQNVNKTETAIRIVHIPTGIVVTCQNERSQLQNKETALKMLKSKLIAKKEEELQKSKDQIQGELKKIEWGSQIRSYVFDESRIKDHRTGLENTNVASVMDGNIHEFIMDYLKKS
ncbi:MAG: peptide chain release factor 2 [Christensenellaceae bacterium]|nr:peptide chain release factor 2 [Christensenellaceae bacterium]